MYDLAIRGQARRVRANQGAVRRFPGSVLLTFDGGDATATLSMTYAEVRRLVRALNAQLPARADDRFGRIA